MAILAAGCIPRSGTGTMVQLALPVLDDPTQVGVIADCRVAIYRSTVHGSTIRIASGRDRSRARGKGVCDEPSVLVGQASDEAGARRRCGGGLDCRCRSS